MVLNLVSFLRGELKYNVWHHKWRCSNVGASHLMLLSPLINSSSSLGNSLQQFSTWYLSLFWCAFIPCYYCFSAQSHILSLIPSALHCQGLAPSCGLHYAGETLHWWQQGVLAPSSPASPPFASLSRQYCTYHQIVSGPSSMLRWEGGLAKDGR